MTTTKTTGKGAARPAKPPVDAQRVKELLASGRTTTQVADLAGWPRASVLALINGTKGWLLDPATDTVYNPDGAAPVTLVTPIPGDNGPDGGGQEQPKKARPGPSADGSVDELLATADGMNDKTVQRELTRTTEAVGRLREAVATVTARREVEAEVADLEARLAAARARAKQLGVRGGKTSSALGRPSNQEVRAWAKARGIDVNEHGKVRQAVVDQYLAAHQNGGS